MIIRKMTVNRGDKLLLNRITAEKYFLYFTMLFALLTPIAEKAANTALTASIIVGIFLAIKYNVIFKNIVQEPLIKPLLLLFTILLLTVPFSSNVYGSFRTYLHMLTYVFPFVVFILLRSVKEKYKVNCSYIFHSYLMGCTIAGVYAIYQYMQTKKLYVTSFYDHHVIFASFLETSLPIIAALFMRAPTLKKRLGYLIAGSICLYALILTQARGPWIATLLAFIIVAYHMRKHILINKKFVAIGLIILVVIGFLTMPLYFERARTIVDPTWMSNYHRLLIWESTINMLKDYPLTGIGLGQFFRVYNSEYISPLSLEKTHPHAHNSYLMIGSETGIVALAAFLYLLFQIFTLVLRLLQSTQKDTYVVGYIGIFISVIVSSCVDSFFWASYISKIIWLMLGLIVYEGLDGRYLRNIRGNNHE